MNPYLKSLYDRYDAAIAAAREVQSRAAGEHRDLTETESTEVRAYADAATALVPQIDTLAAEEQRTRALSNLAESIRQGEANTGTASNLATGEQLRSPAPGAQVRSGNAQARDRDPGHYRSTEAGGEHSFFRDLVRAKDGDHDAGRRLEEHNRALSTGVAGAGLVPPQWLTSEYDAIARQGRVVSAGVRQYPITTPSPITLPRQTTGTDAVVAEQSTENTHPAETDAFATSVDVVTPKPISGIQTLSRQMLDMADPAADLLIYGDMVSVYNTKVEAKVVAALVAAATTSVTFATEATFNTGQAASDAIITAAFDVWAARKLSADSVAMRIQRWGKFNKLRDTTGRKLYPASDAGPMNVDGIGSVQSAGNVEGLVVHPTDGLGSTAYPESILVYRASDTILFEGAMQRFRFEEIAGPESIKLGIWGYVAVLVRQSANSVRRVVVTAAS